LIFSIISMSFSLVFAEAGNVTYIFGKVQKRDLSGKVTRLRKKESIVSGDTIITFKNGQVMLIMLDDSKITIRPDTEFFIEKFLFKKNSKNNKSNYELAKGGFRSVTGIMGQKDKNSFKLKTNIATMGIRGTDFDLSYCELNCSDNQGLFVKVVSGSVSLSNDGGTKNIDAGDIGHVSDVGVPVKLVDELPKNMRIGKKGKSGKDSESYPTHEEQMVAIALNEDPSAAMFQELVDSELPKKDIVKGAVSLGMEPTGVVETLLNIDPDNTDEIIEQSIDAIPERASDFTTIGVALGDVSDDTLRKIEAKEGIDPKAIQSGESLGKLIAPRKEKRVEKVEKNDKTGIGKIGSPVGELPKSKPEKLSPIDPQLLPGQGTGGGKPPSPS